MFFYFFLGFVFYHKLYVNNSDILVGAMEEQLLSHNSIAEYKHLTYSETTDRFIFCNKVSFNRNDTVHLAEQAVKKTNLTKQDVVNKTSDELITDLKYLPCEFSRDELFSIVLINDVQHAEELKARNKDGNLTVEEMKEERH